MIIKMILTNAFDPDPRVYKEAKTLIDNGHEVEILCWDRENKYKHKSIEVFNGIKIKRFFPDGKYGSGIKQLRGYIKYAREILKYLRISKYDFIHCHDFDALFIGYIIKLKNRRIKLVYDEHDLFYLYFKNRQGFINQILCRFIKGIELRLLRRVDYHIVVTPNMKNLYKNRANSIVITNAPLKDSFKCIKKPKHENIVIGFIGAVRYIEELKVLVDATNNVNNIDVFIAGKGTKLKELEDYINIKQYKNIELFGEYKFEQLENLYSHIDITYLVYPIKDAEISLPNKFFESIITETTMIANKESEFGKIISENSLGWTIDSKNVSEDLHNIFLQLGDQDNNLLYYKNNIKNIKETYFWESNINKLKEIFND